MNSSTSIRLAASAMAKRYQSALRRYVAQGHAATGHAALNLGRQAVAMGLETLDLALIHEQALVVQVLSMEPSPARDEVVSRSRMFFAEAIVPLEETHRLALEANVHLSRLNVGLSRRTQDLVVSNRRLKKEIRRREMAEETLRKSEQNTQRLLERSRLLHEELRCLSRRVLLVQEEERKRISRELHDVIAQMLTGINVRLATLKMASAQNSSGMSRQISRTQRLIEKSVDNVHRFARELRPAVLDDLGLIPALHAFLKSYGKDKGIHVSLTACAEVEALSAAKRVALYRVAHEALTNVARHARAERVKVTIRKLPTFVCMDISDNGRGFDVEHALMTTRCRRLGLLGMRERVEMLGGKFAVESAPGKGTTVHAQIPFSSGTKGSA